MSLREKLNEKPLVTGIIAGVIVLIALIVLGVTIFGGGSAADPTKAYFSNDDGQNWFEDDKSKIPPFDKDGKPAYRAYVFKAQGGKEFVARLERYSDADKKLIEAERAKASQEKLPQVSLGNAITSKVEVKRPGDKDWVKASDSEKFREIMGNPKPPTGSSGPVEPVYPD